MPEWGWIIVFALGSPAAIALAWRIIRHGGKIGIAGHTMVINGHEVDEDQPQGRAIKYVIRSIGELEELLYGRFLAMIADRGADRAHLTEYEDSMYIEGLIHSIVTGGNGTNSWLQIIQGYIVDGEWVSIGPLEYVEREIWPHMLRSAKSYLNDKYKSKALGCDGVWRDRWVTNADLVDEISSDDIRSRACRAVAAYIEYAQRCTGRGCSDE